MMAPGRFWIIRYQNQSKPQVVAKFDTPGGTVIPDSVANHESFNILEVPTRSDIADKPVDHSVLSGEEQDVLSGVYPIQE